MNGRIDREITCIMCPLGCRITVTMEGNRIVYIKGNECPNGEKYARQEVMAPSRIVMSVVKCRNCIFPVVSVKTEKAVPKELMGEVVAALRDIEVEAPVSAGDVIIKNVLGLGINVVATRSAGRK